MVGIGYTPEGLPDNYLTTDLLFEMGHKSEPVDLKDWVASYTMRRYGTQDITEATKAWWSLLPKVLNSTTETFCAKNLLNQASYLKSAL